MQTEQQQKPFKGHQLVAGDKKIHKLLNVLQKNIH